MFQISSEMLGMLKNALVPQCELAMNGPQIYSIGRCSVCTSSCKNVCKTTCQGCSKKR